MAVNRIPLARSLPAATMSQVAWFLTSVYLCLGFLTPIGFGSSSILAFSAILIVAALAFIAGGRPIDLTLGQIGMILLVPVMAVLIRLYSPYGATNAIKLALVLCAVAVLLAVCDPADSSVGAAVFYAVSSVVLAATFLMYIANPDFFADFSGVQRTADDLSPVLYGAADKNRTALFVFLYFCFSLKRKKLVGIALSLLYPAVYAGRQYLMMMAIVVVVLVIAKILGVPADKRSIRISPVWFFSFFAVAMVLMVEFSRYWIREVIPTGLVEYKTGLNDHSNALRTVSIDFIATHVADNPHFLFYGYDARIFEVLGINIGDTRAGSTFYVDGIYRLVQPHQEVLNVLVKEGAAFTIVYFAALAVLLSRFTRSFEDLAMVGGYMVGSIFLHEMFITQSLLMLAFVLAQPSEASFPPLWRPRRAQGSGSRGVRRRRAPALYSFRGAV